MTDSQINKKIESFRETVLKDAEKKKSELMAEMDQVRRETYANAENEALNHAYNVIQKEKNGIIKERHEKVSKIMADSKKALLKKREEILQKVYGELYIRIDEYRRTEEYKNFLLESMRDGIKSVGNGDIAVIIDEKDKEYIPMLQESSAYPVSADSAEIIGGSRVINRTKNIICDNSLAEKLAEVKAGFLEETGLFI